MKRKDFDFNLAKKVHNNFYSYDKVICVGVKKKVIITCPKHGDFLQTPYCHIIRKQGCSKCQYEQQKQNLTFTKEEFICNANKVHNGKYNYDDTIYVNTQTKVNIKCELHGCFNQLPLNHVNKGKGCPKCKSIKLSQLNMMSTSDFINVSKSIHGSKYDYTKVNYTGMKNSVEIICPQHGTFTQKAGNHIYVKNGCPNCGYNVSKSETEWLDSLFIPREFRQKIININGIRYKVDAYDIKNKTIYEYFGSFWHGNPKFYNPNDVNPKNGKTFGELYKNTLEKINNIENAGYKLIYEWGK
jgi:hypothetical protein